ncbi:MAG: hypothetical protein FWE56_05555, partial [Candidatus Bathyarchaeota archaeon]|nr:hypothetical protein [Candidatus Termiticorpusculum sp.]
SDNVSPSDNVPPSNGNGSGGVNDNNETSIGDGGWFVRGFSFRDVVFVCVGVAIVVVGVVVAVLLFTYKKELKFMKRSESF